MIARRFWTPWVRSPDGYREVPAFNAEPYAHHWFEKRVTLTGPG